MLFKKRINKNVVFNACNIKQNYKDKKLSLSEVSHVKVTLKTISSWALLPTVSDLGLLSISRKREHLKNLSAKLEKVGTIKTELEELLYERKKISDLDGVQTLFSCSDR